MNIQSIIDFLNKELGKKIPTEYYAEIDKWRQWWAGNVKDFHEFHETSMDGTRQKRKIYSLQMPKKLGEDWGACLLNEKTTATIANELSSIFIQGNPDEQGTGGVFRQINFWSEANGLVEKAFYSGTGAFVAKVNGLASDDGGSVLVSPEAKIRMEYLPAFCIIPLTVDGGEITEVAFASETMVRGEPQIYLESHMLENGTYVIENRYFKETRGNLVQVELPEGVAERMVTGSPYPFFQLIRPNIINPYDNNLGLGCSVYSQAIDILEGVDIAYNNFNRDMKLGGKKVFYNREMLQTVGADEKGNPIYITPDDAMQQLFHSVGDGVGGDDKFMIQEFNPSLRVEENAKAVQTQLDYLSFRCGLGTRHYKFDASTGGVAITARQYTGEKQTLKQMAEKHNIIIEKALIGIIRSLLWIGKNFLGQPVDPETSIVINFSDGYIVSDDEKKAEDLQDVREGIRQPWEYRMRWYGEDETKAKSMVQPTGPVYGEREYGDG